MTNVSPNDSRLVSFVIVTHQRPVFLEACLHSVRAQDYPESEIIVVVNPADPHSEAIATQYGARVFRTHANLGAFPAVNLGIINSNGNRIMIVDDDATFESNDALSRLNHHLDTHPDCAIAVANIRGPCESAPYLQTQPIHVFKNGFALFRREVFTHSAGYIPDRFFRAGGETFISNYIYDHDLTVFVVHDVWMFHAQTAMGRSTRAMNHYSIRNHALLVLLQEPSVCVFPSLGAKVVSSFVRIAVQRRDLLAWISGWLSFLGNAPWAIGRRKPISIRTYLHLRSLRSGTAGPKVVVTPSS
jgi:glycosyltransferase involved in cell wall biosynthesis